MFLQHQSTQLKETTIKSMANGINRCVDILTDSGWYGDLDDITPDHIRYIQETLSDVKTSTARAYLRDLGYMLEFYTGRNVVIASGLNWSHCNESVTRNFLKKVEVMRLVEAADPLEKLILMLGCTMGLRRAEMAYLRLDDIRDGEMTVRGKGIGVEGKVSIMGIPRSVREALEVYLPIRRSLLDIHGDCSEGRVLIRTKVHIGEPLSPGNVGAIVTALGQRVSVHATTHSLRRFYAVSLRDTGVNMEDVKLLMRHEHLSTTRKCYLDADTTRLFKDVTRMEDAIFG